LKYEYIKKKKKKEKIFKLLKNMLFLIIFIFICEEAFSYISWRNTLIIRYYLWLKKFFGL